MIPDFQEDGTLPPGIHWAEWTEFSRRFGGNAHRGQLLAGLKEAVQILATAGCAVVYVDGSFVTSKDFPNDFDACWDMRGVNPAALDPVFLDFSNSRAAQKSRFMGEFFPAQMPEGASGKTFSDFFQTDRDSGNPKGIVAIDARRLLS
jgi:hypothetical protein